MRQDHKLLFITVPPPKSGNVVEYLTGFPSIVEAAAVYTAIDVIAYAVGPSKLVNETIDKIPSIGAQIKEIEEYSTTGAIPGPSAHKGIAQGLGSCFAFVRCLINTEDTNFEYATQMLLKLPEVRYIYPVPERKEIVVQIIAPDKVALDSVIMSNIQESGGMIKNTRTFITINKMHWAATGIPRARDEYLLKSIKFPIFMGLSEKDIEFGSALSRQLHKDTSINIWNYGLIKPGVESWSKEVDTIIENATGFLFLITEAFLASSECQREFGRIEGIAKPENICCLVLPPCSFKQLPHRYETRQCVDGKKFFAYSSLVDWIKHIV